MYLKEAGCAVSFLIGALASDFPLTLIDGFQSGNVTGFQKNLKCFLPGSSASFFKDILSGSCIKLVTYLHPFSIIFYEHLLFSNSEKNA